MDNDYIVKYICKLHNIDLSKYEPINEDGEITNKSFDKRFSLDRTYQFIFNNYKRRIRFVKYDSTEYITMFKTTLRISRLLKHKFDKGMRVYTKDTEIDIHLDIIKRSIKLNKIKNKMDEC